MAKLIFTFRKTFLRFESRFLNAIFGPGFPPGICPVISVESQHIAAVPQEKIDLKSIFENSFLFAVPKTRRTLEKKRNRKFGWPQYVWKPFVPKTNILMCDTCGHDYEAGHLCGNCYKQVKLETEEMQKAIQNELKLDPVDKEVVVLYEGEVANKPQEFWKGKRIVEMKKPRPQWFSANLLQKTTSENYHEGPENKNIKPPDLA